METRCDQCGYVFPVPDESIGLLAECPHCGAEFRAREFTPGDEIPLSGAPDEELSMDEPVQVPSTVAEQQDNATRQAVSGQRSLLEFEDTIRQPNAGFVRDVLRSFALIFTGRNAHMGPWLAMLDGLILAAMLMVYMGDFYAVAVGGFMLILLFCWHACVLLRTCEAACSGNDDLKIEVLKEGIVQDLMVPFVRFVLSIVAVFLPLLAYWQIIWFLPPPRPPIVIDFALVAMALFIWPSAILTLVLGDTVTALTPGNISRMITGAIGPYLAVWAALLAVGTLSSVGGYFLIRWLSGGGLVDAVIAAYIVLFFISTTLVVMMRVIGLMYSHFKAKLPFAAE